MALYFWRIGDNQVGVDEPASRCKKLNHLSQNPLLVGPVKVMKRVRRKHDIRRADTSGQPLQAAKITDSELDSRY